jgi:hypothetical protein
MRRLLVAWMIALLAAPAALGAIAVSASPTSASVSATLTGDDLVKTFAEEFTVTGEGSTGWDLTAWAAAPTGTAGTLSALTVTALPTSSCGNGACSVSVPTSAITGIAWPLALGTTSGTAAKFWNAGSGTGTNKNQFVDVTFGVPVPAKALVGTYTTTLTVAVATGP